MLPFMLVPTEGEYITTMYRFYLVSGLGYLIIFGFLVLGLPESSEFIDSYSYDTQFSFLLVLSFPVFIFLFMSLPFLIKLFRYWRKNQWLSIPLIPVFFQFLFLGLSAVLEGFIEPAAYCFVIYGIIATAAGIYGIKEVKPHDNLTLKKDRK